MVWRQNSATLVGGGGGNSSIYIITDVPTLSHTYIIIYYVYLDLFSVPGLIVK
jgi:hypothetical protein